VNGRANSLVYELRHSNPFAGAERLSR